MSVLGRKARRDVSRQRWQYASVGLTVLLGVALFAASYDAFLNLEASYERTYERLVFADLTVTGGDSAAFATHAGDTDGVAVVATRREADIPIRIDGNHAFLGRIVEMPDSGQPAVNQVAVLAGTLPDGGDDTLSVERHMADHFDLGPGSRVEVLASGTWRSVEVGAVVASPEYIWPARSRQDLLTSADDFGVLFAPSRLFEQVADEPATEVVVRFDPSTDATRLPDDLTAAAVAAGASGIEVRADQPSNAALQEDVSGFGELSFLFPVLFLGAATMATFILLGRVVRAQQAQIATLLANGVGSRRVVVHYLGQGLLVTVSAGIAGLVVGVAAGRLITGLYTDAITVPDTVTRFHLSTAIVGLGLSVLTGAAAAAAPALAAGRIDPGEALRGVAPAGRGGRSLVERVVPPIRRLPARWRMVVRGLGRNRRRSLSTTIGVILALTLMLTSWGMIDTVEILLDRQFTEIQRQDAQLYIDPAAGGVLAAVEQVSGVERVEPVVQTDVVVAADGTQYTTELVALGSDTEMHDFAPVGPPRRGLVAGRSLGEVLGVGVGDDVTVRTVDGRGSATLAIEGFVDEPLGTFVYADLDAVTMFAGGPAAASLMVRFSADADRDLMRQRLSAIPGVVAYVDSRALYDTARGLLSLFYAFVGVMLVFGSVMAFALIFNTATVNASERSSELAAMKVNGASTGQLARLMAGEHLLLTLVSIVPGLAIGYGVSALFMDSFSSDLFDFGLQMRGTTLLWSALAILAVSAAAQWPTARAVDALDVARIVRERSQ